MRDNSWLEKRLDKIWKVLIPEIEKKNKVSIIFKGRWKNKFAHIKRLKDEQKSTEIAINSFFRHHEIPDFILDTTIAHELVHYMHGFHSPYEKKFKHPHKGGIVDKELKKRGFNFLLDMEKEWIKTKWENIYKELNKKYSAF